MDTMAWNLLGFTITTILAVLPAQLEIIQNQIRRVVETNAYHLTWGLIIFYFLYQIITTLTKVLNDEKKTLPKFIQDLF